MLKGHVRLSTDVAPRKRRVSRNNSFLVESGIAESRASQEACE